MPLPPERHSEQRFLSANEVATLAKVMEEVERDVALRTAADARERFEQLRPRYQALVLVAAYGGYGSVRSLRYAAAAWICSAGG